VLRDSTLTLGTSANKKGQRFTPALL